MRALLIAPRTNLTHGDSETSAVLRSGMDVTPLLGDVSHDDLVREIETGNYDVLWILGHGTSEGIGLSDGLLPNSLLIALVAERFSLIVLNTCESIQAARSIQRNSGAHVIATIGPVGDREAYQTGALFARALADTGNIEIAYHRAATDNYVWLAQLRSSSNRAGGKLTDELHELTKAIYDLRGEINLLKLRLENLEKFEGRPLLSDRYASLLIGLVALLTIMVGSGLFMLVTR